MPDTAIVLHHSRGRLRIRVLARRHDRAWFCAIRQALAAQPGIDDVKANPSTATLTLRFAHANGPASEQAVAALTAANIQLQRPQRRSTAAAGNAAAASGLAIGGYRLRRSHIALGLLLLLLIRQLLRTGWWAPALALGWLLFETLPRRGGSSRRAQ
jgi:hypothetical protein